MKLVSTFFRFILLRTGKIKLETDSYAILFQVIERIFIEASGYLVPNMITFGQNRVLWGLFVGKNVPPRHYHRQNLTKCFFLPAIVQLLLKVIENASTRNLGGI